MHSFHPEEKGEKLLGKMRQLKPDTMIFITCGFGSDPEISILSTKNPQELMKIFYLQKLILSTPRTKKR